MSDLIKKTAAELAAASSAAVFVVSSLMRTPRWRSESAFADALYLLIRI